MYYVYALLDPGKIGPDAVRYIGMSKDPVKRVQHHLKPSSLKTAENTPRGKWFMYLSKLNQRPDLEIIHECLTEDEAFALEAAEIAEHRRVSFNLLNVLDGGKGAKGLKHTKDVKDKMSSARTGAGNNFFGRSHTEETKKKISASARGRAVTEETRKKLSDAGKGRKHSYEHCKNIGKAQKGSKNHRARSVRQLTLDGVEVRVLGSISSAAEYGFSHHSIRDVLRGRRDSHKGYRWEYA